MRICEPRAIIPDNLTETAFLKAARFWEKAINHYLATGEKLKRTPMD